MRYEITYDDGFDISSVWEEASCREEAVEKAKEDYWDIKEIISVVEL